MVFAWPGSAIRPQNLLDPGVIFVTLLTPDSRGKQKMGWPAHFLFVAPVCSASFNRYERGDTPLMLPYIRGRIEIRPLAVMDLNDLLETTVTGMGYELAALERPARGGLLRVYIDKPGGVSVDDCAAVSHQLTRVLAVENVSYDRLEVSSPGMDRLLRKERDFARFAGQRARVRMRIPLDGQRNFTGVVREAGAGRVALEVDGKMVSLELADMETARLVPNI
jgi:ribosome maturation factor RimP